MSIVDKIETFVNETKEMSLKKVMDKIEDGYWEAEEDVKVGKHVTIRDTKTKKRMTILVTENLDEASQEKDLDPKKKIVVKGVKGMKSKPFTKKFKNMDAYDKWSDSDEFGDYEVHQIMNEEFDDSELDEINEAEDVHNFVSDMIMDFEKKLGSVISKGAKSIDPTVLKDLKKLEDECSRVRKGKLHDIRPGR